MAESDKTMGLSPEASASLNTPSLASRTLPSQPKTTSSTTDQPNENVIQNGGTGDNWQIMVSTNDKVVHGTNKGRGWRNRQLGGNLADASVQKISADMVSVGLQDTQKYTQNLQDETQPDGIDTGFGNRHGPGHTLDNEPQAVVSRSTNLPNVCKRSGAWNV